MVDDFGVKYVGHEHAIHLKDTLEQHYKVTNDWRGKWYIGIALDWVKSPTGLRLFIDSTSMLVGYNPVWIQAG